MTSTWFFLAMGALQGVAAMVLWWEGKPSWAVVMALYAAANVAYIWAVRS